MLWNKDGEHLYMTVREPNGYRGKIKTTAWGTWPTSDSWNWPGHEGKEIEVEVYSRYPRVRLYLNDKLIGEKETERSMATFTLSYTPGTLRAEGINGNTVAESVTMATADEPASIRLTADRTSITADGQDLAFITIEIIDNKGRVCPTASAQLKVSISGPASVAAFGNADIKDTDRYTDSIHKTWNGRALLAVRSKQKAGSVTVKVEGDGLTKGQMKLITKK